jgi:hypothetical protein
MPIGKGHYKLMMGENIDRNSNSKINNMSSLLRKKLDILERPL